jgi:putative NIF3 family GTP cyclohydrolase 1 type 2
MPATNRRTSNWIRSTTLALSAIALFATAASGRDQRLTAREVVARIQQQVGVPWQSDTVDTFKAGDPDTPVTGIAVTMMATLDVLQRAAAAGDNLIITHEPTFFDHMDVADQLPEKDKDPVLTEKKLFISKHNLVVWRFHDHWHARNPDGIEAGMVHALGWKKFQDAHNQYLFDIPETPLEKLASDIKRQLGIHIVRVVGDPDLRVTKVAMAPGAAGFSNHAKALEMPGVQTGDRRSAGVGNSRVCRRRGQRGQTEIPDHSQSHPIRTGRHGRVHAMVENLRERSSNPVRSSTRTFLESEGALTTSDVGRRASDLGPFLPRTFDL